MYVYFKQKYTQTRKLIYKLSALKIVRLINKYHSIEIEHIEAISIIAKLLNTTQK